MHLGCCSTFGNRKNTLVCGSSIFTLSESLATSLVHGSRNPARKTIRYFFNPARKTINVFVKDHAVKSVLLINKGGPTDINIAQILHLSNFFELYSSLYSFTIANQKSVRYSVSISYFTIIAVQSVNKGFVYITDLAWSLTCLSRLVYCNFTC
jgi:hypothetical protein